MSFSEQSLLRAIVCATLWSVGVMGASSAQADVVPIAIGEAAPTCHNDNAINENAALLAPEEISVRARSEATEKRWQREVRAAMLQLAEQRSEQALVSFERAEEVLQDTTPASSANARTRRINACLSEVRALQTLGDDQGAFRRGMECRHRVPVGSPTLQRHPPEVLALLNSVDGAIASDRGAVLQVTTERSCRLMLNGSPMPVRQSLHVAPGRYVAQVVCGSERTPLFEVVANESVTTKVVATPAIYKAVHRQPCTHLHFSDDATYRAQQPAIERAAAALGLSVERASSTDGVAGEPSPLSEAPRELSKGKKIAGFTLIGAGAATGIVSAALLATRGKRGRDLESTLEMNRISQEEANDWLNIRAPMLTLAAVTPALITTGAALSMKHRTKVPWWGWTIGGVGLGAAAFGAIEAIRGGTCSALSADCISDEARRDRGAFFIAQGVALLAIPIVQLVKRRDVVAVEASGSQLRLRVTLK